MEDLAKTGVRLLRFLSRGPASAHAAVRGGKVLLETAERGTISLDEGDLDRLAAQGVLIRSTDGVALSRHGVELARQLREVSSSVPEGREIGTLAMATEAGPATVLANLSESPLAQMVRMKTKVGKPFLAGREFEAGERLRADYTRGQFMPRLGANWIASVASGKRAGGGGVADLTDAALGARLRVERAIAAVGPELSGVLIDICCFLKGLEQVEAERGWPVRSAKIVLKTALAALARHYCPQRKGQGHDSVLHWGAENYRPRASAPPWSGDQAV
jgi:hypothetical protein